MRRLILIFVSAFFLFASPAAAKEAGSAAWIVSQLSGDARVVHNGLQPASLKVNSSLAPGDLVITGPSGRATLTRGEADYIVIAPRSELRLPSAPQPNGFTRIIENFGTMLFKVRRTGVPHFAVDTPMLAAVVKGTTFTVTVGKDRSAVQVIDGAVEVTALDGGMSRIVEGGRAVFIDRADTKRLIDADAPPANTTSASPTAVKISGSEKPSLTAIAGLTGGLVRPAAAPPPTSAVTVRSVPTTPIASNPATQVPSVTEPITDIVQTVVAAVTEPVANIVQTTVPAVTEPITDIVQTVVPAVTEPITDIVQTTVPAVTEPVANIVQTTVPAVTEPVANIVQTTVPAVTEPVIDIVQTTVPAVTEPVVDIVQTTVPLVTAPVQSLVGGLLND